MVATTLDPPDILTETEIIGELRHVSKSYTTDGGREYKVLATNTLDEGSLASPAIAGKAIFVRTKTHLYRIES